MSQLLSLKSIVLNPSAILCGILLVSEATTGSNSPQANTVSLFYTPQPGLKASFLYHPFLFLLEPRKSVSISFDFWSLIYAIKQLVNLPLHQPLFSMLGVPHEDQATQMPHVCRGSSMLPSSVVVQFL